jgi:hypothetical protein
MNFLPPVFWRHLGPHLKDSVCFSVVFMAIDFYDVSSAFDQFAPTLANEKRDIKFQLIPILQKNGNA